METAAQSTPMTPTASASSSIGWRAREDQFWTYQEVKPQGGKYYVYLSREIECHHQSRANLARGQEVVGGSCPYEYVEYGNLPAVTVSCFWTNDVESRVGVVTPHVGRQMHCSHSLSLRRLINMLKQDSHR